VNTAQNPGFETIASPATYASGAVYHGKLYVSGPSGLSIYGAGNRLVKTYRVGLDLPAAPLGEAVVLVRERGTTGAHAAEIAGRMLTMLEGANAPMH
jgi:hypothetical protein